MCGCALGLLHSSTRGMQDSEDCMESLKLFGIVAESLLLTHTAAFPYPMPC